MRTFMRRLVPASVGLATVALVAFSGPPASADTAEFWESFRDRTAELAIAGAVQEATISATVTFGTLDVTCVHIVPPKLTPIIGDRWYKWSAFVRLSCTG